MNKNKACTLLTNYVLQMRQNEAVNEEEKSEEKDVSVQDSVVQWPPPEYAKYWKVKPKYYYKGLRFD